MTPAITFEHVTKRYGRVAAVDDFSVEIRSGSIFGLLGRNGAGKTTAFSCALGLVRLNGGRVLYGGSPLRPAFLNEIAYVPETPALFGWMTMGQHIEMQRRTFRKFDMGEALRLCARFELPLNMRVRRLSKGQKTAGALVLAFAQRAAILFLDEPSSGLDPLMQRHALDLILTAGSEGQTILLSSHQIGQIERAAESVAIMHRGRIATTANLDDLRANRKVIAATFEGDVPALIGLEKDKHVLSIVRERRVVRLNIDGELDRLRAEITKLHPSSVEILNTSLESIFLDTIGAPTAEATAT